MNRDEIILMAREAGMKACCGRTDNSGKHHPTVNALFSTVPVQWLEQFANLVASKERDKPLTDKEIQDVWCSAKGEGNQHGSFWFARAIEKAHGIK